MTDYAVYKSINDITCCAVVVVSSQKQIFRENKKAINYFDLHKSRQVLHSVDFYNHCYCLTKCTPFHMG